MITQLVWATFQVCMMCFGLIMFQLQLDDVRKMERPSLSWRVYGAVVPVFMTFIMLMIVFRIVLLVDLIVR